MAIGLFYGVGIFLGIGIFFVGGFMTMSGAGLSLIHILYRLRCAMLNFFIGFAFFEAGAIFGFFVAALLNAAHAGQESTIFEENDNGTE